jgi:phosphate transport system substrate-binding protein
MARVNFPANFRVFEADPAAGYPITGLTWMMVYKQYDPQKSAAIKEFVRWVLTDGQNLNGQLEYTRISPAVTRRVLAEVNKIR